MVRKTTVCSRMDSQTLDALDDFCEIYSFSRSEAILKLTGERLEARGYSDEWADPAEKLPSFYRLTYIATFYAAAGVALVLIADVLLGLTGRSITTTEARSALVSIGVLASALNLFVWYGIRYRIKAEALEALRRSRHRLLETIGEAKENLSR